MDRRPDRGLGALNKYNNHQEANQQPRPPQHRGVTPLNVSMEEILVAILDKNMIQWPQPLRSDPRLDLDQYCQYHRTHGHDTKRGHLEKGPPERFC